MRITLLSPSSPPVVLGDDGQRVWISRFLPKAEWAVQVSPLFRSAEARVLPRLNQRWTIRFEVERTFEDTSAAQAFVLEYPASLPAQGSLEILQSNRRRYFKNAALREFRVTALVGVTVQLAFTFVAESTATNL